MSFEGVVPNGTFGCCTKALGPFETLKVVKVRSVLLSFISKATTFLILGYVVGYNLLYNNRHFVKSRPNGIGRLQLQRPTKHHCNPNHPGCEADFTPLEELPYCKTYAGDHAQVPGKHPEPGHCKYFDEKMMNPSGATDTSMLIPTRATVTKQKRTKVCQTDSHVACSNIYEFDEGEVNTFYIADIERFTLLIDHAFMVPFEDRKAGAPIAGGASTTYQGFFEVCEDPFMRTGCEEVQIPCFGGCHVKAAMGGLGVDFPGADHSDRRLRGDADEEKKPEVVDDAEERSLLDVEGYDPKFFSIKVGDIIPMGELLKLAGIDLNTDVNAFNESRRYEGSVVQIDIDYVNIHPFMWPPWEPGEIRYVYRVSTLPMSTFKEVSQTIEGEHRLLTDWHGIFVKVSLTGSISYVSPAQFILVMTTSIGLLAAAETIVHLLAMYVVRKGIREEYTRMKYDSSVDFDKNTMFQDQACAPKTWDHYSKSREAFIDDFKSADGEVVAMAAHTLWEIYHNQAEHKKNAISSKVTKRCLSEKIDDEDQPTASTTQVGYAAVPSS